MRELQVVAFAVSELVDGVLPWPRRASRGFGRASQESAQDGAKFKPPDMELRRAAHKLGRPKAVRACRLANGANPIAIAACHRGLARKKSRTRYGGGIEQEDRNILELQRGMKTAAPCRKAVKQLFSSPPDHLAQIL